MTESPTALLVMSAGPGRRSAAAALRSAGFALRPAREPYEATALVVEARPALVVVSLSGLRTGDLAFLKVVARHAPAAKVLLLVPSGRRRLAARALVLGADACLPEPFYPEEVAAVASRLVRPARAAGTAEDPALPRLAHEVAHAVNNPLQVLSLLAEEGGVPRDTAGALREEVARVRRVVRILDRFAALRAPALRPTRLGPLVRDALRRAEEAGDVRAVGREVLDGPEVEADGDHVGFAIDCLVEVLGARGEQRPQALSARVRTGSAEQAGVEAAVRAAGVHLPAEEVEGLRRTVLWSHEETRRAHPGLAVPETVARGHAGVLLARETARGTVLALRLPRRAGRRGR